MLVFTFAMGRHRYAAMSCRLPSLLVAICSKFAIPGETTGTWPIDNTPGDVRRHLRLHWDDLPGSYTGSWQAGNFIGYAGMSNQANAANTAIAIGRFGLYADPDNTGRAPPWATLSDRQVLQDCMRYWFKIWHARGFVVSATTAGRMALPPMVPMRVNPALGIGGTTSVLYDIGAAPPLTSLAGPYGDGQGAIEFDATGAAGGMTAGRACIYTSTTAANFIAANARM